MNMKVFLGTFLVIGSFNIFAPDYLWLAYIGFCLFGLYKLNQMKSAVEELEEDYERLKAGDLYSRIRMSSLEAENKSLREELARVKDPNTAIIDLPPGWQNLKNKN